MNRDNQTMTTWLRIWQQNINKSITAQHSILSGPNAVGRDLIALQEPHINTMRNISSNNRYHALYP
ncbi:hypothetical protein PAXRUDRAFT_103660, partial [Paxillus rubicundulus Ve08.2h10]